MRIRAAKRVQAVGFYAFAEVDKLVEELKSRGISPIDFGVGDPTEPTPEIIRRASSAGLEKRRSSGYPGYIGSMEFRQSVSDWTARRYGLKLDPETEISSTIGAKEAVFNFHEGLIDPGDYVLCPSPGYPPYTRGTLFAEGIPFQAPWQLRPSTKKRSPLPASMTSLLPRMKPIRRFILPTLRRSPF